MNKGIYKVLFFISQKCPCVSCCVSNTNDVRGHEFSVVRVPFLDSFFLFLPKTAGPLRLGPSHTSLQKLSGVCACFLCVCVCGESCSHGRSLRYPNVQKNPRSQQRDGGIVRVCREETVGMDGVPRPVPSSGSSGTPVSECLCVCVCFCVRNW